MATGGFDPNCIVPVTSNITVGTSAVQLKNSSTLSIKFTLSNPSTNPIYLGDVNVATSRFTVKIIAGSSVTFEPADIFDKKKYSYDLARFYAVASAAAQTATLTLYSKGGGNGQF